MEGPYDFGGISYNVPWRGKLFPGLHAALALIIFSTESDRRVGGREKTSSKFEAVEETNSSTALMSHRGLTPKTLYA